MKYDYTMMGLMVLLFTVFWNILDFLWSLFISRSGYQFGIFWDLVIPAAAACVIIYILLMKNEE